MRLTNKPYPSRFKDRQELKAKKGLKVCKSCQAVFYKKSWHHPGPEQSMVQDKSHLKPKTYNLKPSLCPACQMIKNHQFEGEIAITNFSENYPQELINLIKNFCQRAYEIDSMDRLIGIKKTKDGLIITTTENQLAVKLAKKIKDVFKKVQIKISYSSEPSEVVHIKLIMSS